MCSLISLRIGTFDDILTPSKQCKSFECYRHQHLRHARNGSQRKQHPANAFANYKHVFSRWARHVRVPPPNQSPNRPPPATVFSRRPILFGRFQFKTIVASLLVSIDGDYSRPQRSRFEATSTGALLCRLPVYRPTPQRSVLEWSSASTRGTSG